MSPATALELLLLAGALAAALAVRPWRLLSGQGAAPALLTPLLGTLTFISWIWSWPATAGAPLAFPWSGAPLAVLMLGWPLAVPVLALAGFSTIFTAGASWADAASLVLWSGVLPATGALLIGHGVRHVLGPHPVAYLLGRGFAVPLLTLFLCMLGFWMGGKAPAGQPDDIRLVAAFLLAMGEAGGTCMVVTLLVACRPQWLATWSDALYLGIPPRRAPRPLARRAR